MAFTGTAVQTAVGVRTSIVTGLSLAAAASGTIGNAGAAGAEVELPSTFPTLSDPETYVEVHETAAGGKRDNPITYVIAGTPPLLTITNLDGAKATGALHIRIRGPHTVSA
jgi:hypothetical protein